MNSWNDDRVRAARAATVKDEPVVSKCCSSTLVLLAHLLVAQSSTPNPLLSADALRNRGEYDRAIAILVPLAQSGGANASDSARAWTLLGSIYQDLGRYPKAQSAYERAIRISRHSPECEYEEAVAMDNLGSLYLEVGQPKMSKRLRLRVLKVAQEAGDHAFLAKIYNNLTAIALGQKRISEARTWIRHALAESKLAMHLDQDNLAAISSNAGWLSMHDHDYQRACDYYEVALRSWIERHGPNHQLTGWGYVLRGQTRALQGETGPGLDDVKLGLGIIERAVGTSVPLYFAARLAYSDVLSAAGSLKQAKEIRSDTLQAIQSFRRSTQSAPTISADAFR